MVPTRRQVLAALPCSLALAGCLADDAGTSIEEGTTTDGSGLFGPIDDLQVYNSTPDPVTVTVRIWPTPNRSTGAERRTGTAEGRRTETTVAPPTGAPPFEETVDLDAGATDDGEPPSGSSVSFEEVAALDARATVTAAVEGGPSGTYLTPGGVGTNDQLSVSVEADDVGFGVGTV